MAPELSRRARVLTYHAGASLCTPMKSQGADAMVSQSSNGHADGHQYYLLDPYRDFLDDEQIPVVEAYAVDCLTLPVEPWQRLGGEGAYIHLAARGDYL